MTALWMVSTSYQVILIFSERRSSICVCKFKSSKKSARYIFYHYLLFILLFILGACVACVGFTHFYFPLFIANIRKPFGNSLKKNMLLFTKLISLNKLQESPIKILLETISTNFRISKIWWKDKMPPFPLWKKKSELWKLLWINKEKKYNNFKITEVLFQRKALLLL